MTGIGDTAAEIRTKLDEHRMVRGTCLGCTRKFGGVHDDCSVSDLVGALRAVLDLIADVRDDLPEWLAQPVLLRADEIESAIAQALGVSS